MRSIWGAFVLLSSLLAGVVAQDDWRTKVKVQRNGFYPLDVVDKLEEATMTKVEAYMAKKVAAGKNNGCTLENAGVRREWGDMTIEQRTDFINATLCLMNAPPKAPKDQFPGVRSRYHDFMAYHMTNAGSLHDTIGLFPAHKYFVLAYETALRNECGYKGYHPYMNYDRYTKDAKNSALFNGNATSMGGNGEPDPRYTGLRMGSATIKSAGGGGCVTEGPFKDYMATVGPGSPVMNNVPKNPVAGGGGYNPRCMRRDVNSEVALGATADKSYNLITMSKDINTFYNTLLTPPVNRSDPYNWGIHNSGHYISGGDPGGDPMVSPGDPIFYFHHAMLDRLWWIWQMQEPDTRVNAQVTLGGTSTSRKIDLKWLIGDVIPVLEAHDGLGGHGGAFCHVYV
ncbi:hypothetical protein C8A01DRAFT_20647 [Parachaetomium inaequale]|uniref:Tyrosinase copper-binding domain-containing protein n=1 Tax=Parachaetomium inaequale TaxID=2588326 RepID=A0AAN6P5W1_9PEZI|nr:hypothetical protein C8A01DRAFT_20647 [Parachaetomium inaequale]